MSALSTDFGLWCLQSETTDGSTVFINSNTGEVFDPAVTFGDVYHSTDQALFGNSSIYISGTTSDYIQLPSINSKSLDFQIYSTSNNKNIIFSSDSNFYLSYTSSNDIVFSYFNISGDVPISYYPAYDIITVNSDDHNFLINQWNHIYLYTEETVNYNPFYGVINGILYNGTMATITTNLKLGINGILYTENNMRQYMNTYSSVNPTLKLGSFDGYVEEIRQSNDVINTDFTPLSEPYAEYIPPTTYSISGTTSIQDILTSGITVRIYNRATGILEGTAISNESGNYTITDIPNNDLKYLICLDKNSPIIYNSLIRDRIELGGSTSGDYIELTIDHTLIDSDLTDFPLLINLSTSSGISDTDVSNIFTVLGENKYKIKLKDSSDIEHYIEIETWDSVNNKAVLHTKVNLSSSVDTVFKLYYDSAYEDNINYIGVTGSIVAQNVWDSNHKAVFTLAQDPSGGAYCILDSTSKQNHGTPTNMDTENLVDVGIGKGLSFDGTEYITTLYDFDIEGNFSGTLECLVIPTTVTTSFMTICIAGTQLITRSFGASLYPNGVIRADYNGGVNQATLSNTYSPDTLHYIAITKTPGAINTTTTIYIDGNIASLSTGSTSTPNFLEGALRIGCWTNLAYKMIGNIGLIKLSNASRSNSWISATNKSLRDELITIT